MDNRVFELRLFSIFNNCNMPMEVRHVDSYLINNETSVTRNFEKSIDGVKKQLSKKKEGGISGII